MLRFDQQQQPIDFEAIRLRLAAPETIRGWSFGEVTKPETINYRTQKPEKSGLFAEEIFGPSKDWECYCGKYKKIRYKGIICDKCGVEVTTALVRRERMGHIELASPVAHIWFLRSIPSKIGLVLDMSVQSLEKVIYFANFIITKIDEEGKQEFLKTIQEELSQKKNTIDNEFKREMERSVAGGKEVTAKLQKELDLLQKTKNQKILELEEDFKLIKAELNDLEVMAVISEATYRDWSMKFGHLFEASIGAEAIRQLLERIDLPKTIEAVLPELDIAQGAKRERLVRRVKLLKSLNINNIRPEWMVFQNIPIIPPDLRPMVPLDGGRFATSDVNDLYRRVINRNNRLKRLNELNAPEVITRNEKRMLQEAVDALIDNSARHTKAVVAATGKKRQLKSLADVLKGKQGRFRQNLLGKRIDYSGRSVIVVGPKLKIHQCGLPKKMALELFKPFVISKLIERGLSFNIRSANRIIESERAEVWDILEEITKVSTVLLNRAPTLHRLGIQAFHPILIEGKAIQIHPMVCTAFNADFDGDQMAVHVPLTEEAKHEASTMMLASNNLLKPATGLPVATPGKDIVWGCYYMSQLIKTEGKTPRLFGNHEEALLAYALKKLTLNEPIITRIVDKDGVTARIETTVGRLMLNQVMPKGFGFINDTLDTKKLSEITRQCIETYGLEVTAIWLDDIKDLGYKMITLSGYSWGMSDLPTISIKQSMVEKGEELTEQIESQYMDGLLTASERHSKIIEVWSEVKDEVAKVIKRDLPKTGSIFTMLDSGARGTPAQLTQIIGMKGLVSNPAGDIIELPIKKNFKEGLDVLEYFIATHGSRKGSADTALRTANAGYLTRRLVDVAQDVIIKIDDCGDDEGVELDAPYSREISQTLAGRALGRFSLETIKHNGKTIIKSGEVIDEKAGRELEKMNLEKIRVRSVFKCKLPKGLCKKCYGFDLAYNKVVAQGVAVGIVAAQSIGEPGTQLTMRTFHTGGVAGSDITQGLPRVEELFEARPPKRKALMADVAGNVTVDKLQRTTIGPDGKEVLEIDPSQKVIKVTFDENQSKAYKLAKSAKLLVTDNQPVQAGEALATTKDGQSILSELAGVAKVDGKTVEVVSSVSQTKEWIVPPGFTILVKTGDLITPGDLLTDGHVDLQELFKFKGKEAVKKYLLSGIQSIYTSQGQKLNDKHIEIIIRQMFSRVYVKEAGDTELLPGEIVEKALLEEENKKVKKGGKIAEGDELFLGITKVSLSASSFLSAASFQETAKVLINASLSGRPDRLEGLKENVIIGRLIPAGTGFRE